MIRLGACRETQGRLASAWSAYKDSLTRVKDPKKKAIAEAKVKELEPRLSYLTVLVPDESRVDGLEIKRNGAALDPALWNRAAPVDGGTYTISGQAPGHEAWTTTVEVAVEADTASVEVPKFKELRTLVETPPPPPDDDPPDGPPDGPPGGPPGMFTGQRKIAVAVGAVGVLAVVGGALLGMQAGSLEDDAFRLCPDPEVPCDDAAEAQAALDKAQGRALFANVAFGVGAAAVIGAAVLWFTGAPDEGGREVAGARVGASAGPGVAKLDLTWRF
jgi:hypothetical protein